MRVLVLSTLAFTLLFAVWLMFGILGKPVSAAFGLSKSEMYWLGGTAVLMGSLLRLPLGILADRIGGRNVMVALLLWTALPCALVSFCESYVQLLVCAALFGIAGNSFSVGIAWNSAWFSKETQGTALGTFGAGNVGASVTKVLAPGLMAALPAAGLLGGLIPGGWRAIPVIYSVLLVAMAAVVYFGSPRPERCPGQGRSFKDMLTPLREVRVWRFGLYYIVVFGAYVALSLWLPMYYQDIYGIGLAQAGLLTCLFIFPASLLRPLGGYFSDRFGARPVTLAVMFGMLALCVPLSMNGSTLKLPIELFTALVVLVGVGMGVGKASVYRYIPDYFPKDVGAVGGLVGTLGALGGFFMMPLFGMIEGGGIRQSAFLVLVGLTFCSLTWLLLVVTQLRRREREALAAT
jgi:NNP family nitrate/nitrite transporter-like MFS transporter